MMISNVLHPTMRAKGYALAIVGSMCYGLNPLFALPLYAQGVDPVSVLFYRYSFAVLLIGMLLIIKGEGLRIKRKEFLMSMAMGLFFALSSLFLFLSFNEMDAGIASTILFTYPLFVVLIMAAFFKEKTGVATWIALLCAGSGIGLLYKSDGGTLSTYGIILVLLSAITYAVYLVGVNRSVLHSLPTLKLAFYATLSGAVMFGLISIFDGGIVPLTTIPMWGNAFGLSVFHNVFVVGACNVEHPHHRLHTGKHHRRIGTHNSPGGVAYSIRRLAHNPKLHRHCADNNRRRGDCKVWAERIKK